MKIEHIAIYVNRLDEERDFFVKYFGAKPDDGYYDEARDFRNLFLKFDDGSRLELMTRRDMTDPEKEPMRTGYIHIAISVGSKETVDEITAKLKSDGYTVVGEPRTTGDGYYESCVLDTEGNQIEITI